MELKKIKTGRYESEDGKYVIAKVPIGTFGIYKKWPVPKGVGEKWSFITERWTLEACERYLDFLEGIYT